MLDKFLKGIKSEIISQIEEVINETAEIAKTKNLNAIDTLNLINENINSCITSINNSINIDDELLTKIALLKKPFVSAAKKEAVLEVSKIIENESSDVTSKINNYMNKLKQKGINLDESKNDVSEKFRKSKLIVEPKKEKNIKERQHILKKTEPSRSIYSSCPSDSCGGSSSSCGGGC